jgi:hypothetical protein
MYSCGHRIIGRCVRGMSEKADAFQSAEGSRSGCYTARIQVTTGVLDQGMSPKG